MYVYERRAALWITIVSTGVCNNMVEDSAYYS
jgi:hypothetical protein